MCLGERIGRGGVLGEGSGIQSCWKVCDETWSFPGLGGIVGWSPQIGDQGNS